MASTIPTLHSIAHLICTRSLLKLFEDNQNDARNNFISTFLYDDYGEISLKILHRIVEYYPEKLTDSLLYALVPEFLKSLRIPKCPDVTACNLLKVFQKCRQIQMFDISECEQLMLPALFGVLNDLLPNLTTVNMDGCRTVTDEIIQTLLKASPSLQHLSIARCNNITDNAFLLDIEIQDQNLMCSETAKSYMKTEYCLISINLSTCDKLTSLSVALICSLVGPTLENINVSYTNISTVCLLYLSGYSLSTVLKFLRLHDFSLNETEALLNFLTKIKLKYNKDECKGHEGLCDCLHKVKQHLHQRQHLTLKTEVCDNIVFDKLKNIWMLDSSEADTSEIDESKDSLIFSKERSKSESYMTNSLSAQINNGTSVPINHTRHNNTESVEDLPPELLQNVHPIEDLDNFHVDEDFTKANPCKCEDVKHRLNIVNCDELKFQILQEKQYFIPNLKFVDVISILSSHSVKDLDALTFPIFFLCAKTLTQFSSDWSYLCGEFIDLMVSSLSNLRELYLPECNSMTEIDLMKLNQLPLKLRKIDLKGIFMLNDCAVQSIINDEMQSLSLSECSVTDKTLEAVSKKAANTLKMFDLSWCEEITRDGINVITSSCTALEHLNLRHCLVTCESLFNLAENCKNLRELSLSCIEGITDEAVVELARSLMLLEEIDISWNSEITDVSIKALFKYSTRLKVGIFTGNKRVSSEPMYYIVSDLKKWEKSQTRKKIMREMMIEEMKSLDPDYVFNSAEEEELIVPKRSTVYAPNLKKVDLCYVDYMDDTLLARIVAFCFGSIQIIDYYGEIVKATKLNV